MDGFKMDRFTGSWYAIETTFGYTRCVGYDFYPKEVKCFKPVTNYQYFYGKLEFNKPLLSDMTYLDCNLDYSDPDLNRPSFVVVETDYVSYAIVFMCLKMVTGNFNHYVSILSRTVDLDPELLNYLMKKIWEVSRSLKLKHVNHTDCNYQSLVAESNDENVIDDDINRQPYVTVRWVEQPIPVGGV
ncbi:uncharacterized protein LOC126845009 [Adelges cooleyi]|uniref:uncharacterized protein LOC126845009 n=1 Tax=Adelges cooleyi TaxID=133065 RepID=UPI00217F5F1C|nr:uncharacterized protein LOC126845009 [Adelges cooleyi]